MGYEDFVGLYKTFKPGMCVRVPIDTQRIDRNNRDFRIGKIEKIDDVANTAIVVLLNFSPGESPKEDHLEYSLRDLMRCRVLPETIFTHSSRGIHGKVLIDCEDVWVDGAFKHYYVQLDGIIQCISENDITIPSHRQNPNPFQQLHTYELQHPIWRDLRNKVVISYSELKNSTYGMEDLVGSRVMLLAHQAEVIARVLGDPKLRYVLADEVGLGKTIEACVILKGLQHRIPSNRTLIITPDSLTTQWKNELDQKFWLKFPIINATEKIPAKISIPGCIISAEDLTKSDRLSSAMYGQEWGLLIVDEAHHIAKDNILFERVKLLSEQSRGSLILSATPIQQRSEEFLGLLRLMDPERYETISESTFTDILQVQGKIRRKIAYISQLVNLADFDIEEFLDEMKTVANILTKDQTLIDLISQASTLTSKKYQALEAAQYIVAYLSENYRIENRVIRNRRANLNINLPERIVDTSYSYIPDPEETVALESLFDYLDNYIRDTSVSKMSLEYCRLLLFAAFSSPLSLSNLLNLRRQYLVTHQQENKFTGDILRPASHRLEHDRIVKIVSSLPAINGEIILLDSLIWQVDAWHNKYVQQLKTSYSYNSPPASDTPNRLLQVIRALYNLSRQKDIKILVFSAWSDTLNILQDILTKCFGSRMTARFSCEMDGNSLERAADKFQVDEDCQILLSDELGGEGRNFQIADYIIHVDIPWTPAQLEQRIGRVDRLGRSGKVTSIVPYAKDTIEEDLYDIWQNAFGLFTKSMSGLEIALEGIQDELRKALAESIRNGLSGIKGKMTDRANELREIVEEERYFEQGAINQRRRDQIKDTSDKYRDGQVVKDAFLAWADLAGLNFNYTGKNDIIYFNPRDFNPSSMHNARFVDPPNMEESLRRSRRQHNLVITGTFNRDVAIREEDLIFFAPGNDPWTDTILRNSFESDRGRCCGIGRKIQGLEKTWEVFELLFSISVNPRPLYRDGFDSIHLFRAQGYLQTPYYKLLITKDGEILNNNHPIWKIIKVPHSKSQDWHLGKRDGQKASIGLFREKYSLGEWSTILKCVHDAAKEKLQDEFEFMQELAEEARLEFHYQSAGQRAARQFLYGENADQFSLSEIAEYERVSEALIEGIAHPIWELESICFWLLQGEDLRE
jgi:superfamily II DNA or RNA helicase